MRYIFFTDIYSSRRGPNAPIYISNIYISVELVTHCGCRCEDSQVYKTKPQNHRNCLDNLSTFHHLSLRDLSNFLNEPFPFYGRDMRHVFDRVMRKVKDGVKIYVKVCLWWLSGGQYNKKWRNSAGDPNSGSLVYPPTNIIEKVDLQVPNTSFHFTVLHFTLHTSTI